MRIESATAAIKVASSIEAHLTGAVEAISLRNQGVSGDATYAVQTVQTVQAVGHLIYDFVSVIGFKAKAFSFCLFFYPVGMAAGWSRANGWCHRDCIAGWSRDADTNRAGFEF